MSPEVALLIRAALLGLLVLAIEHFGRRRQAKCAELRRALVRLPATQYPAPTQLEVVRVVAKPAVAAQSRRKIVRLEPRTTPAYITDSTFDGHVTEKRAA